MLRQIAVVGVLVALWSSPAAAEVKTFTIVPEFSSVEASIWSADGTTRYSSGQTAGSDLTKLFGSFNVDVTATTIQFLPTGDVHLQTLNQPQAPLIDGSMGTSPAQFGLSIVVPGLAAGVAAGRNYLAEVSSPPIPYNNGAFDASQTTIGMISQVTSYNLTLLGMPVEGYVDNTSDEPNLLSDGQFGIVGNNYVVLVQFQTYSDLSVQGVSVRAINTGTLMGLAPVPEPGTLALACSGLVCVGVHFGRRRARCGQSLRR